MKILLFGLSISFVLLSMFILSEHPLVIWAIIVYETLFISVFISHISLSSWFSYLLVMIYLSGMMIIFLYISSLVPNKYYLLLSLKGLVMIITLGGVWFYCAGLDLYLPVPEAYSSENVSSIKFMLTSIFNKPNMILSLALIIYLLLALIVVVKIAVLSKGPMRLMK